MTRFEHELRKVISEEILRLTDCLTSRTTIIDHATYNYYVGQMAGLERVLSDYLDEANQIVAKDE